jgi:hypothetical protein
MAFRTHDESDERSRRLRSILGRIYQHVDDVPGTEDLQAELEREVFGEVLERDSALSAWSRALCTAARRVEE